MRIRGKHKASPPEPEVQRQKTDEGESQSVPLEVISGQEPPSAPEARPAEPDQATQLQQEVAKLQGEVEDLKLRMLQTMAEAQNMRKRTLQQMEDARKFAAEPLVKELLKVCDNFARAIAAAETTPSFEALLGGVKVIEGQLSQALKSASVERIPAVGQPFDPHLHDAVDVEVREELDEDTVVEELVAGYAMHGRVVRPAKVRVSKQP